MTARDGTIVVGCGRTGAQVAIALDGEGRPVTVIDTDRGAFARLPATFGGRTVVGNGFDRGVLDAAGAGSAVALAAVMYGDNSNVVAARVAREVYEIPQVVARIKDPWRAEIYGRLGVQTLATTAWAAGEIVQRLCPAGRERVAWTDPTGGLRLVEWRVPAEHAGRTLQEDVVAVTRGGVVQRPADAVVAQEGDVVHLLRTGSAR